MGFVKKINQAPTGVLILIISLLGFLVYSNCLPNAFVWDDEEQIVKNTFIQDLKNFPKLFTTSTFYTGGTGRLSGYYYRPTMTASFMASYALWGPRAFGFHLFQVLLHLANASLVFLLLFYLFGALKAKYAKAAAFLSSLIFVVHPGSVEAVSYIASTQEVLYTFFSLLALLAFIKVKNFSKSLKLGLSLVFLALLSKESAVIIIPIIFLYLFIFKKRQEAFYFAGFSFFVFFAYVFLRVFVAHIPLNPPHFSPIAKATFSQRLLTIPFILFSYLRLIFYPRSLSVSHHELATQAGAMFWGPLLVSLSVFLVTLFWLYKTKSKLGAFFFLWFSACLAFVLNIFPLDMTFAERWLYFPLVAFIGLASTLVLETKKKPSLPANLLFLTFAILILLFSFRTFRRCFNWRDGLTLFSHDVTLSRDSFDLENNLGVELFRAGRVGEAKVHFEKSIKLEPGWWFPYNNLGAVYAREGDWQKAKEFYQKSIEIADYYVAYENLCSLMLAHLPLKETIAFCEEAVAKLPQNSHLRKVLAIAYYRAGENQKAAIQAKAAFTLAPTPENQALFLSILHGEEL